MSKEASFLYGGQAVIEGVMIRGRNHFSLAVRRLDGSIERRCEPLNPIYTGRFRRWPFLRGILVLVETMALGIKALHLSANMAIQDEEAESGAEIPSWVLGATPFRSPFVGDRDFLPTSLGYRLGHGFGSSVRPGQ